MEKAIQCQDVGSWIKWGQKTIRKDTFWGIILLLGEYSRKFVHIAGWNVKLAAIPLPQGWLEMAQCVMMWIDKNDGCIFTGSANMFSLQCQLLLMPHLFLLRFRTLAP
ncbi:MAG: hypothetical protein G8345_14010 [Magnetococcales bacterium]|nr:hypothetical protein [Magnetococcales bacterium]NGZ27991.1 hypothetical protein [Magnetococcales bacterium]